LQRDFVNQLRKEVVVSSSQKLAKQTGKFLEPGESIVAAAKCLPRGHSRRRAAGGLFGVVGVLAAGNSRSGPAVFGRPLPANMGIAVTNRRILVCRLSEATEKVAEVTHSIPMGHVTDVQSEVGKSFGMKAVFMTISFTDGSTAALEAVRPNTKDGELVAQALVAVGGSNEVPST
jgi:hypothetical protein